MQATQNGNSDHSAVNYGCSPNVESISPTGQYRLRVKSGVFIELPGGPLSVVSPGATEISGLAE